jgi:hypothetical protein
MYIEIIKEINLQRMDEMEERMIGLEEKIRKLEKEEMIVVEGILSMDYPYYSVGSYGLKNMSTQEEETVQLDLTRAKRQSLGIQISKVISKKESLNSMFSFNF